MLTASAHSIPGSLRQDILIDGKHHLFPVAWVERVDQHVHLNKSSQEAKQQWQTAA